jgi:hypothetical protein
MHILKAALVGLTILLALSGASLAQDALMGKWKLNLEKSKYDSVPPPKSQMLNYEPAEGGMRVTVDAVGSDDQPVKLVFGPFKLDEKPYPVTGSTIYDNQISKKVDDRNSDFIRRKGEQIVQTGKRELSADGKLLTITVTGRDAKGQQYNAVSIYDKQ